MKGQRRAIGRIVLLQTFTFMFEEVCLFLVGNCARHKSNYACDICEDFLFPLAPTISAENGNSAELQRTQESSLKECSMMGDKSPRKSLEWTY
jgi:hypothetical protein